MKRTRITLAEIAAADNLALAAWKAARGKRDRPEVADFLAQSDRSLARLGQDILAGSVPYGCYRRFTIHDPKHRVIHAACFEDRVLHHAIINLAERTFERALVPSTYACRPGLGVHRAVAQVQRNLQRYPWFGKVDVDGYFPSIDHARLVALLRGASRARSCSISSGEDRGLLHAAPGKGLPIGSLTSQHFANHYLDGADRFLVCHPLACAHVRYMDDIIWWGQEKDDVKRVLGELRALPRTRTAPRVEARGADQPQRARSDLLRLPGAPRGHAAHSPQTQALRPVATRVGGRVVVRADR